MLANACGPCIGQWKRDDIADGTTNSIISSFNRNFAKRNDGNPKTASFISSPEIVIAYALAGKLSFNPLTDGIESNGSSFKLEPPKPAPEIPAKGFIFKADGYLAPPEHRSGDDVKVDNDSNSL